MIAIKRLQGLMWILVVAAGALSAYLISLRVATERSAVRALERQIYATRSNIRYLEAEFGARGSMRQLEAWNAQDLRYSTPQAGQYLHGEQALAQLDRIKPNGEAYVPPPVMVAMVTKPADVPAATIEARAASPAPSQIRPDFSIIRSAMANDRMDGAAPAAKPRPAALASAEAPAKGSAKPSVKPAVVLLSAKASEPSPVAKKAARMAMLDAKLLDDAALREIGKRAPEGAARADRPKAAR